MIGHQHQFDVLGLRQDVSFPLQTNKHKHLPVIKTDQYLKFTKTNNNVILMLVS